MVVPLRTRYLVVLLVTVALANWHWLSLGLYYDDWIFSSLWGLQPEEFLTRLRRVLSEDQHGRPLGNLLLCLLFYLGRGVTGCYLLSLVIQATLAWLCWRWLERAGLDRQAALVGALFWVLNPADQAKFYLVRAFHVELSVGMFLLASLAFLQHRLGWAYLAFLASLLTYENTVVPFFLVPLLQAPEQRRWRHHLSCCLAIIALVVLAYRLPGHPGRLAEAGALGGLEVVMRSASACVLGPLSQFAGALLKTRLALLYGGWLKWLLAIGLAVVAVRVAGKATQSTPPPPRLWAAGGLLWASSYVPMVTGDRYPPTQLLGQLTSSHCGGWPGQALLVGLLWSRLPKMGRAMVTFGLATALVFQWSQQGHYVLSWQVCCSSWQSILQQIPDAEADDIVLVEPGELFQPYKEAFPWCNSLIYPQLVNLSSLPGERQPAVAVLVDEGPRLEADSEGVVLRQKQPWIPGDGRLLQDRHLIVVEYAGDGFFRREGVWPVQGVQYLLKAPKKPKNWGPGMLHQKMIAAPHQ